MSIVTGAILPTSRNDLEEKIALFASIPNISRIQIDVVDGKFATPASWPYSAGITNGKPVELTEMVQQREMLPELHRISYEIDLMCFDTEDAIEAWIALGASRFTVHAESVIDLSRFFSLAKERFGHGLTADMISFGLALNMKSNISLLEPFLDKIEYVQFMCIDTIGRQGQKFNRLVLEKIRSFHTLHPNIRTQVDGGVSLENARELALLGVSNLVVGSGILRAEDPLSQVEKFEEIHALY